MSSLLPPTTLTFVAPMTGLQEVPPTASSGSGFAQIGFLPGEVGLQAFVSVQGLRAVTRTHIHLGLPGQNGPIVLPFFENPQGVDASVPTILVNQIFTATDLTGPLAGRTLSSLLTEILRGNAYVNVHTRAHPDGEIRGQLQRR
jgi:hypothetical protein